MGSRHCREAAKKKTSDMEPMPSKVEYTFKAFVFEELNCKDVWPKPRSGHRAVSNKYDVYTYGGYNPDLYNDPELNNDESWAESKPLFREVWKYSIAKCSWSKVPAVNVPFILASNAVILQGNILLVYGGTGVPFGERCSNSLYVCNLAEEVPHFREIRVEGDIPDAQYGQAIFIYEKYLYTIGGTTGYDYSCDVHRLDLTSRKWEIMYLNKGLPHDPPGRYRHELGLQPHKSKVYIFGGGSSLNSYGFEDIPVYDISKNEWHSVETFGDASIEDNKGYPLPRRFHSLVQGLNGEDVFITGGECGIYPLSDTWKINLETLRWTRIDSLELRKERYFHAATLSPQGKMYLFGGVSFITRTEQMLTAWLCIPKLQEICWEAVLYYNLLDNQPKESLSQLLAPEFLRRLE